MGKKIITKAQTEMLARFIVEATEAKEISHTQNVDYSRHTKRNVIIFSFIGLSLLAILGFKIGVLFSVMPIGIFLFMGLHLCILEKLYYNSEDFSQLKKNYLIKSKDAIKSVEKYNHSLTCVHRKSDICYNCSKQIVNSAKANLDKYVLKYFFKDNEDLFSNLFDYAEQCLSFTEEYSCIKQTLKCIRTYIYNITPWYINPTSKRFAKEFEAEIYSYVPLQPLPYQNLRFVYVSPKGNSHDGVDFNCTLDNLKRLYDSYATEKEYKLSAKAQRNLMSKKLRESILERDHYTCQKCGISIKDEPHMLFEVDHIIPVAKGGLTDPANLQTLCWRCNRQKGAK